MRNVFLWPVVLLMLGVQVALGCSLAAMQLQRVPPDITIAVTHRSKPIAGITVEVASLSQNGELIFHDITDDSGTVQVRGLPVGRYYLTATHRGLQAAKEWIEVVAGPEANAHKRFDFEWAGSSHQTRRLAGTLTGVVPGDTGNKLQDIIHPKKAVYSGVAITLTEAFSEVEYRTVSDSTGSFVLDGVPDGTYILTIGGGMMTVAGRADATTLVVDLTQTSDRNSLPLQLKDTGCYRVEFELTEK